MPKYFIDSNIFVYAKIGDTENAPKKIIKAIYEGKIEAITDNVVLLEG